MLVGRRETSVVARDHRARAAVDDVRAVLALRGRREAEQVGAAADDVVLAEVAEDDVIAGVALDVVIAVGHRVERRTDDAEVRRRGDAEARRHETSDRAIALDRVVATLAEDLVVVRATGDVIVPEAVRRRRRVYVEQGDAVVGPDRRAGWIGLPRRRDERGARRRRVVERRARELAEARVRHVAQRRAAIERDVVAEDQVFVVAAVDAVRRSAAGEDVLAAVAVHRVDAADRVRGRRGRAHDPGDKRERRVVAERGVVARVAVHEVGAEAAKQDVVVRVAVQRVIRADGVAHRADGADVRIRGRQDAVLPRLIHDAVVAEQDVVAVVAAQRVAARREVVEVLVARGGDVVDEQQDLRRQAQAPREVEVEAVIAVDVVVPTLTVDGVVARATREVVAGLAADDRVVPAAAVDRDRARVCGRVDDVVAVHPDRVAVRVAGRRQAAGGRVVEEAVLARVAEDDER